MDGRTEGLDDDVSQFLCLSGSHRDKSFTSDFGGPVKRAEYENEF